MADHIVNGRQHQDINPVSEPKNYALTGKIMLSAIIILFAVVVIMVFLHIYARWYLLRARRRHIRRARRRTHLVFYIEPDNPTTIVPIPTHGLDPAVLKSLPTFTFSTAEEQVLECAVCLSEFEEGEKGRMLPKCNHCFHVECIDMWFHSHSTCPLCRSPVDSGDVQVVSDYGDAVVDEVVVELSHSQLERVPESSPSHDEEASVGVGVGPSSSFGGRRKGVDTVGVSIEVPPRRSQSFCFGVDESGPSRSPGFKSPTGRILSLKRIWSREKKSPLPSPSGASARSIGCELDIESG